MAEDLERVGKLRADSRYHVEVYWDEGMGRITVMGQRGTHLFPEKTRKVYVYPISRLESLLGKTLDSKVQKAKSKMQRRCDKLNTSLDMDQRSQKRFERLYTNDADMPDTDERAKVGDMMYVTDEGWSGEIIGITDLLGPDGGRMLTVRGPNKTLAIINE
jgi:hypothetical protein